MRPSSNAMFDIIREKYLSLLFFFFDLDVYFLFRRWFAGVYLRVS